MDDPGVINRRILELRTEIAAIRSHIEADQLQSNRHFIDVATQERRRARLVEIMAEVAKLSRQLGRAMPERKSDRAIRDRTPGSK